MRKTNKILNIVNDTFRDIASAVLYMFVIATCADDNILITIHIYTEK